MSRILQVFYILFSGIILSLAIPNEILYFGSPFLGFISLIPLYIAISKSHSYKEAALLNGLHAITVHVLSSFWLANFKDFAIFTLGASAAGTGVIGAFFGWMLYFPYSAFTLPKRQTTLEEFPPAQKVLYFAAVWTIWEWTKSTGFLAYPWGTLSMTAYKAQCFIQIADITGALGISFLMALFSATIAQGLIIYSYIKKSSKTYKSDFLYKGFSDYKNASLFCITLLCISQLYGIFRYTKKEEPVKFLDTIIVQQNTDSWQENGDTKSILVSEKLSMEKLKEKTEKPDLVVWSEAVLRFPFPQAQNYYITMPPEQPLTDFIQKMNVPVITGAPFTLDRINRFFGNGAVFIDSNGNFIDAYCKIHLVPFAEVIPGLEFEWVRNTMKRLAGFSNGWKAGNKAKVFKVKGKNTAGLPEEITFSTPICFEDAFPDIYKMLSKTGSELFINLTDDSWSLTRSAEYQHFVIGALRSIEFRQTTVRCTNSGYSTVIDNKGRIIADLPLFEPAALRFNVPVFEKNVTVFERYGYWIVWVSILFCAIFILKKI